MNIDQLTAPEKGFTKAEREWIKTVLIPAIKTVQGIAGRNVNINNTSDGQTINVSDCDACP